MGGCTASQPTTDLRIQQGQYQIAFAAAREALRDVDFSIDRVDAYNGVLTTHPKFSAGIATPWSREQASVGAEAEDLFNRHSRVARVTFEPLSGPRPGGAAVDLRSVNQPMTMRVEVSLLRRQRPGWRLETSAIRGSSRSSDPELAAQGLEPMYDTVIDSDPDLAARIASDIASRLGHPPQ
jgi:hypothetical protein